MVKKDKKWNCKNHYTNIIPSPSKNKLKATKMGYDGMGII